MKTNSKNIVLASSSPRRKEILALTPWEFIVDSVETQEIIDPNLDIEENLKKLAIEKALPIAKKHPKALVIGSDTIVSINGEILGKPKSVEDAKLMLRLLSGNFHQVFTGVAILEGDNVVSSFCEKSTVEFKALTEEEIDWYVSTKEPMDKAGSYGIQGHGGMFVKGIQGDYFNIMGLPLNKVFEQLYNLV